MFYQSIHSSQSDAIALLISTSDLPAATAFSIKESEMSELDPNFIRSSVNGIPSFCAISFTFSWDAFASASAADVFYESTGVILTATFGRTARATGGAVVAAVDCLCLANTFAMIDETLDVAADY